MPPLRALLPLALDEHRAHFRQARRGRGRTIDFRRADRVRHVVAVDDNGGRPDVERRTPREIGHGIFVIERQSIAQRLPGHGPVHRAGVEMRVVEAARNLARHRPFSGARWTVDRDDETTRGHVREYIRGVVGGSWLVVRVTRVPEE